MLNQHSADHAASKLKSLKAKKLAALGTGHVKKPLAMATLDEDN